MYVWTQKRTSFLPTASLSYFCLWDLQRVTFLSVAWKIVWKDLFLKMVAEGRGVCWGSSSLKPTPSVWVGFSPWCWQLQFPECQRKDPACGPDVQVALAQDCPKLVSGIPPFSAQTAVVSTCTVHLPSDLGLGRVILWVPVFDTLPRI